MRIADLLRRRIITGHYGSRALPSESALMLEFASSRNAVRDALQFLRTEGMIARTQGSGTFPASRKMLHNFNRVHSTHDAGRIVGVAHGRFISSQTVVASPALVDRLDLSVGAICTRLEFISYVDEQPVAVSCSYIPGDVHGATIGSEFSGDYYDRLEKSGVSIGSVRQTIEAVLADAWTAEHLECQVGEPVMLFDRVLADSAGTPVETAIIRFSGSQICLDVSLPRH